jgi:hypothetical protein
MNANAQLLWSRITKELSAYFPKPDDHQLVSMICNPVMFTTGIPFIRKLGHGSIVCRAIECFKAKVKEEVWRLWHASFEIEPTNEQQMHPKLIPAKAVTSRNDFLSSLMAVQAEEHDNICKLRFLLLNWRMRLDGPSGEMGYLPKGGSECGEC